MLNLIDMARYELRLGIDEKIITILGRVLKPLEPHQNSGNSDHGEVVRTMLFIASGDSTRLLEAIKGSLNLIALSIKLWVKRPSSPFVGLARNRDCNPSLPQILANLATTVSLVSSDAFGANSRTSWPDSFD